MFTVPATILGIIQVLAHLFLPLPCEPGSLHGLVWKTETERLNNLPGSHSYKWQSGFELSRSGFRAQLLPNMLNAALLWVPWICCAVGAEGRKWDLYLGEGSGPLHPILQSKSCFRMTEVVVLAGFLPVLEEESFFPLQSLPLHFPGFFI